MDRFQNTGQPDWDWWGRLWPAPGETLREVGVEPGDTLAEIGSGNGYFALPAARITAPATVYAVDIDSSLLAELSHLADLQSVENIETIDLTLERYQSGFPNQWIPSWWQISSTESTTPPRLFGRRSIHYARMAG